MRVVADNVFGTLLAPAAAGDTSLVLHPGEGVLFSKLAPSSTDYSLLTLEDTLGNIELVRLTGVTGDTLAVVRAQDDTTARAYPAGSIVEMRVTASLLRMFFQRGAGDVIDADSDISLRIRRLLVAGQTPSALQPGELAVNIPDAMLWVGDLAKRPVPVGGGSGGLGGGEKVSQLSHGFAVGDAVYFSGTRWDKAIASGRSTCATHVVARVLSIDTFVPIAYGPVELSYGSLIPGALYYTSPTTHGALTPIEPVIVGEWSNPVGLALSAFELFVLPLRPLPTTEQAEEVSKLFYQPGHCLVEADYGTPLYFDGTIWRPAQGKAGTPPATGILSGVGPDYIRVTEIGTVNRVAPAVTSGPMTPGAAYYLDPLLEGRLTALRPSAYGEMAQPVGVATGPSTLYTLLWPPDDTGVNPNSVDDTIVAPGHPFTAADIGKPVRREQAGWVLAQADRPAPGGAIGILKAVLPDRYVVAMSGEVKPAAALPPGLLYVSPTVPGELTTTEPIGYLEWSNPIAFSVPPDQLYVLPWRPARIDFNESSVDIVSVQPGHTLSIPGTVVIHDGGGWEPLVYNGAVPSNAAIVKADTGGGEVAVTQSGVVPNVPAAATDTGQALVQGAYYYPSATTPGKLSRTQPTQVYGVGAQAPVGYALSATDLLAMPFRTFAENRTDVFTGLTYIPTSQTTELDTTVPDIYGNAYTFDPAKTTAASVAVHVDGKLLVRSDGSVVRDYTFDPAQNKLVFAQPLTAGSVAQVDVLAQGMLLEPGFVRLAALTDIDLDWSAPGRQPGRLPTVGGMKDGARTAFNLHLNRPADDFPYAVTATPLDVTIYVDGVAQRPDIDFTLNGSLIIFDEPPRADSTVWGVFYDLAPVSTTGIGQGVLPPNPPLDAYLDAYVWYPGVGLTWVDARGNARVVADERARLALRDPADIVIGTLVVQQDTAALWRYAGLSTWVEWGPNVTLVGRVGDLPVSAPNGQLFCVRNDLAGQTLNRLVMWDASALPSGAWRFLNRAIWPRRLHTDALQSSDQRSGDLAVTLEAGHKELKAWDSVGGAWVDIFSEADVKEWISAGALFAGTVSESGGIGSSSLAGLPDLAALSAANDLGMAGRYWVWTGQSGYAVNSGTPRIGADLNGATLDPGDWLQVVDRGTPGAASLHWVLISGNLLSKSRADPLYGLLPWATGPWESGSVVVYNGALYRATRDVIPSDGAPGALGPWVKIAFANGIMVADADGLLPATAPPGEVWLVLSSAQAGGASALYTYDAAHSSWQSLGGAGGGASSMTPASAAEVLAGTNATKGVTPKSLRDTTRVVPSTLPTTDADFMIRLGPDGKINSQFIEFNLDCGTF